MNAPTAVIAEDEPVLRAQLRQMLGALWPELIICAEAADGLEAVAALERHAPQILFLDLQMPGLNGLEVARRAGPRTYVAFVTAFHQHAIAAFEHGALDYLLKPVAADRLRMTVERLKERIRQSEPADLRVLEDLRRIVAAGEKRYLKWLTVRHGDDLQLLTTTEICYLRADNKYTMAITAGTEYLLTSPLRELREQLDPEQFWQIHRSVVVNANAIDTIHRSFRGKLTIRLKQRREVLPVSAPHAHRFKQR